ncbi:glycosyltransferase family 2 protein [Oceanitalea stevensii]|uniref:Glycosyltransferase family 2 protein n=1 Tax=Oceanitalea stevensii TaxID=2763072 RepID=A0ABR8Z504_9MICO|nr:glycosyltransferase family A protein [Oceanitalea stevensii]MBD8063396.1 glycosyltransferase family 2 protein [Oceanitalea stevensii]
MDVSVIIPHYGDTSTLKRAIESALNQTLAPREIIVVDDASPTRDREALALLVEELPPSVRVLQLHKNSGPGGARNAGWDAAGGDVVAFLDSDDSWLPTKLEWQCRALEDQRLDLVGGPNVWVALGDTAASHGSRDAAVVTRRALVFKNRFATSSVMVRRGVGLRFNAERRYAEDYELWLRLHLSGKRLGRIPTPLSVSYKRPFGDSGLSANLLAMARNQLHVYYRARADRLLGFGEWLLASAWSVARSGRRFAKYLAFRAIENRRPR